MTGRWPRRLGAAASLGVLVTALALLIPSLPAAGPAAVGPSRSEVQEEEVTMRIGPSDPGEVVDFQVVLRQPGRAELDAFLVRVADPASPEYQRYLSPEAFGERFGLPQADIASSPRGSRWPGSR